MDFKKIRAALILIIFMAIVVGSFIGAQIAIKKDKHLLSDSQIHEKIYEKVQERTAVLTNFYTYGKAININGQISNVSKDNFENVKVLLTNGNGIEREIVINYAIKDKILYFSTDNNLNRGIVLDDLPNGSYYLILRLKMNNSVNAKYYAIVGSNKEPIEYYTVTKDGLNRKATISEKTFLAANKVEIGYLSIILEDATLPEDTYDIVIDPAHGGKDYGETYGGVNEAKEVLAYGEKLKEALEARGYKVKLTRDRSNTDSFTTTDMYDPDGRISIACKSKAKLMISLHMNNGKISTLSGLEIYGPSKSNMDFARALANEIVNSTSLDYSNNNSFKISNGVYVRTFTNKIIADYAAGAKSKGFEPYNINVDTPYSYTIREVGGVATNAYVDGRNTQYHKNDYYDSRQGIECYEIQMGYLKTDKDILLNEVDSIVEAIANGISNNY